MKIRQFFWLSAGFILSAGFAGASAVTYDCDPSVTAATCIYLNSSVAQIYNNTFINANATIYVSIGATGDVAESSYQWTGLSYSSYVLDLAADSKVDGREVALASLNTYDNKSSVYKNSTIGITAALGEALNLLPSTLFGVTVSAGGATASCQGVGTTCSSDPSAGYVYEGAILLSSSDYSTSTTYNASNPGAFNIATEVEHETDEILGTGSCISPDGSGLSDPSGISECGSTSVPSAVDLFRFHGAGLLTTESEIASTPLLPSYFSFDGGKSDVANYYSGTASGFDYGDFSSNCMFVQDATACGTAGANLNINTDSPTGSYGPEVTILNVLGYNESAQATAPEPGTLSLLSFGMGAAVILRRRRRRV